MSKTTCAGGLVFAAFPLAAVAGVVVTRFQHTASKCPIMPHTLQVFSLNRHSCLVWFALPQHLHGSEDGFKGCAPPQPFPRPSPLPLPPPFALCVGVLLRPLICLWMPSKTRWNLRSLLPHAMLMIFRKRNVVS